MLDSPGGEASKVGDEEKARSQKQACAQAFPGGRWRASLCPGVFVCCSVWASLVAQQVKHLPAVGETQGT